jgi:type II secretory pathway component PulM
LGTKALLYLILIEPQARNGATAQDNLQRGIIQAAASLNTTEALQLVAAAAAAHYEGHQKAAAMAGRMQRYQ